MKLLDIYSYLFANFLNAGAFAKPGRMQSTSIECQYNSIFTKTHVKKIYRLVGIKPDNVDWCFIDFLRDKMFDMHPEIELGITIDSHPISMKVTDEKFKRSFGKAADQYTSYKEAFESQKGIARLTGKTYYLPGGGRIRLSKEKLDDFYQVFLSFDYLFKHISSGGTVCVTNIFLELIGTDLRAVKRAEVDLYGLLSSVYMGCDIVKSANKAYLLEMGPAVGSPSKINKKFLTQLLFTDQNMAAWSTYKSRGLVGGGKGALLLGMDFRSRLPFSIDIWKSGGAQIFLLDGKTGSGKTYTAFQIALSALALGHHVTVLDVKGKEWSQIAGFVRTNIITFDSQNPSFVNTLRLDDYQEGLIDPNDLYNTAVKGTTALFMLVLNLQPGEGNPSDGELVIREAVTKMYSNLHVDPSNPKSFSYTRGMRYADVLPILETLHTTVSYTPEQKHMVHLARARLNAYFGTSGLFSDAFRNEISLHDVLDSQFVIFELNKNQSAASDSLDDIRTFMIQFLDSKKKSWLKSQGKFNFSFYEELQRSYSFRSILSYICSDVTGSRSNNAVIFLLMNSLKVLQGKEAQDIRSNITSYIVGLVEDNDIDVISGEFGRPWLASQLKLIARKQTIYRNCFACEIDTGVAEYQTVFKVEVPKELNRRFRTRTIKDEE